MTGTPARPAVLGAPPAFAEPLPVGQLRFPDRAAYRALFADLFAREYYTNQGPLAERFEARLAERLGVRHAVCVTNATIGLSMVAEALGLRGRVILPAFTFVASAQSLLWSGLEPVFCEVDPSTHHLDFAALERHLADGAAAVLAVNLWGGTGDPARLVALADRYGVPVYFDSAHAFGYTVDGHPVGGFGRAEVFSFHATKVLGAGEGGCIATDDDELAERLRNIRSSYGVRAPRAVYRTANGRMSEAQAGIGLLSLDALDAAIAHNRALREAYRSGLAGLPGLALVEPNRVETSNHQYLVLEVGAAFGLARDALHAALHAENIVARRYFHPGVHRQPPFSETPADLPQTDALCARVLQLPLGARLDADAAGRVCAAIRRIHDHAAAIRSLLGERQ